MINSCSSSRPKQKQKQTNKSVGAMQRGAPGFPLSQSSNLKKEVTFRGWFEGVSRCPSSLLSPSSSAQKAREQEGVLLREEWGRGRVGEKLCAGDV